MAPTGVLGSKETNKRPVMLGVPLAGCEQRLFRGPEDDETHWQQTAEQPRGCYILRSWWMQIGLQRAGNPGGTLGSSGRKG